MNSTGRATRRQAAASYERKNERREDKGREKSL